MALSRKLSLLLKAFEKAAIDNSWKGGGNPNLIPIIEEDYASAKKALWAYLNGIEELAGDGRWVPGDDISKLIKKNEALEETVMELGDEIRMLERDN